MPAVKQRLDKSGSVLAADAGVDVQQPGDGDFSTAASCGSESTETSSVSGRPRHGLAFTRIYREAGISYARGTARISITCNNKS